MASLDYADAAFDLPPYSGRVRPWIIGATPRCGSTYLAELLRTTGVLGVPGEYLHTGDYTPRLSRRLGTDTPDGKVDIECYLREVVRRRTSPAGRFGMKIHFRHLRPALRFAMVSALFRSADFVHVSRRDRMDQAISYALALDTGEWSRLVGSGQATTEAVAFDVERLLRIVGQLQAEEDGWNLFYAANRIEPVRIRYEDLMADPVATVAPVLAALGVAGATVRPEAVAIERQSDPRKADWRRRVADALQLDRDAAAR
ncbi:MAG: Stf0 family sulfotransferase [Alphaproteobacteria bacterium]